MPASIALLTACGGGSDATNNTDLESDNNSEQNVVTTQTVSGTAIDGYLMSALACLDLNHNKLCDAGEPTAITDAEGKFELDVSDLTEEQIAGSNIVVKVVAGQTVDSDSPDEILSVDYTLTAPPGYKNVTPLSTMVESERAENGGDLAAAEEQIKSSLGTSSDLDVDYIAAQVIAPERPEGESEEDAKRRADEFKELHAVAQVLARVIAENLDDTEGAAGEADFDDVMHIVADNIKDNLEELRSQVEEAIAALPEGESFAVSDADRLANDPELKEKVETRVENIEEQIAIKDAFESNDASDNLATLLREQGGINWLHGRIEHRDGEVHAIIEAGVLRYDEESKTTTEEQREYDAQSNTFVTRSEEEDDNKGRDLLLTKDGWVSFEDDKEVVSINEDGSIVLQAPGHEDVSEVVRGEAVNIAGLNVRAFAERDRDLRGMSQLINPQASFEEGAKAYRLSFTSSQDQYRLWDWDCEGDEHQQKIGDMCNQVYTQSGSTSAEGGSNGGPALTLNDMVSQTAADPANAASIKGPNVAWTPDMNVVAEMLADGSVNYYGLKWGEQGQSAHLMAKGDWSTKQAFGTTVYLMDLPAEIKTMDDRGDQVMLYTELDGAVRQGAYLPADAGDQKQWVLNEIAANNIISNINSELMPAPIDYEALREAIHAEEQAKREEEGKYEDEYQTDDGQYSDGTANTDASNGEYDKPAEGEYDHYMSDEERYAYNTTSLKPCDLYDSRHHEKMEDSSATMAGDESAEAMPDFAAAVEACQTDNSRAFTEADLQGKRFIEMDGMIEFGDGTVTHTRREMTSTGEEVKHAEEMQWALTEEGYLEVKMLDSDGTVRDRVLFALIDEEDGSFSIKAYSEMTYDDMDKPEETVTSDAAQADSTTAADGTSSDGTSSDESTAETTDAAPEHTKPMSEIWSSIWVLDTQA